MESLSMQLQPFFEWLLRTTLQASLLICFIFLFQAVLRNKLGARWHYCLWLLLLIRMAMPWAPQSRVSVFNLIPQSLPQRQTEYIQQDVGDDAVSSDAASPSTAESTPVSTTGVVQDTSKAITVAPEIGKESKGRLKPVASEVANILPLVWLTGALALAVYVCASNFNLLRIVKRERPLTDQKILDLLEDCKAEMGIRIILGVVATDKVKSPALFGFVRPRLLLPKGMLETLSREELRYVFLHELAHLKRHDIYIGWLISLLQVLHWFNPLIWLAFYRLRTDRELACDALVLARTQSGESKDYGRTIVSLLELFSRSQRLPAMAGILETKTQLKRRIKMIARFKKDSYSWSPLAIVFIIVLACVALPDAIQEKTFAKPGRHITLRQVWSGGESPWYGKISPDGRYFSFVDEGENAGDLAILDLATGNIRRLTNMGDESENYEYAFFSRWSPDGKQIVYEYEGDFSELRVVGLDGSKPRILYRDEEGGYVRPHDWSPDGKQVLAFLGREGTNQIVLISVEDGSMRVLKTITHGEHPYHWSFSPDGRYIVYESPQAEDSPESDIFLFSVDEKREVPIVEHPANDKVLGWAPDSDWLLFVSDRTENWDAWAISVAEGKPKGNPELIKMGIGSIYPMGFTKNGAFYYTDSKQMNDIYTVAMNPETGKIDSPPNTLPVLSLGGNHNPQYSPDGKYLAYTRNSSLCILSLETSKVRKFPLKLNARYLRWSPDRHYILFNSIDVNRRSGLYRLDVQTGKITPISLPKKGYNIDYEYSIYFNEWSHDGKSFFYVEYDRKNKLCKIINRDFETGNEKELYQGPKYFSISLSPDGQWLAFASRKVEGEIMVMPASGGESRELCKIVQPTNCPTPLAWTADGRYVLFSTVQADAWLSNLWLSNLWRVPIEGGKPQKLGLEMAEIYNLTVHPNGRQIAFLSSGSSSKESEIWVMENFLPGTTVVKPEPLPEPTLRRIEVRGRRGVVHSQPSFDGNYMSDRDRETGNLVVRDIATGKERMLTKKTDPNWFAYESLISPENKRVAFLQFNPKKEDFDLQVIGFDGADLRTLLGAEEIAGYFNLDAWSPDGKYIFGRLERKPMQLVRVSADDGSVQVIKTFDEKSVSKVNVSPDGRYLAYDLAENKTSNPDVFVFDLEENRETPLVKHPANDKLLGWTPDGQHVFFTSDRNGTWDGWLLRVEDGKPRGLPEVIKAGMGDVSPIGFTRSGSFYYSFRHEVWNVYTAKLDLDTGEALSAPSPVRHVGKDVRPDWSPDGQYLAYCSQRDRDKPQIVRIRTLATGRERQLKTELPHFDWLRWCPDSRHLLITNFNRGSPSVVYKLDVQTGEHTALVQSDEQRIRQAELSADGKTLAYRIRGLGNANRLIVRDMETGREKELLRSESMGASALLFWALSPDGKHVAFSVREDGMNRAFVLKIISVASGEARTVVGDSVGELAWINDGRDLLFVKGFKELWRVSAEGGEPRKLWEWKQMLWGLRIHPDEQRLAFFSGGNMSEMWVMENFLTTVVSQAK